ncbi:hypothetical protein GCM10027299_15720 [Larkinella ripae]
MVKILKVLLAVLMVVTWLALGILVFLAPSLWGKVAIIGSGVLINSLLALGYSYLGDRPNSLRDWFKM